MAVKAPSKSVAHHRARVASLSRDRPHDDPEYNDAKRDLRAELLAEHVAKVVAAAPPLTHAQRDRIAAILKSGGAP